MRAVFAAALIAATICPASGILAQNKGSVSGTVRDSANVPIAGVDVWTVPGPRRTRTDSAGRYTIAGLDNGAFQINARKVGFAPDVGDVKLSDGGALKLDFTLKRRADLDTVRVVGRLGCDGFAVTGFECRKVAGGGAFYDYPDIDAQNRLFVAELFRGVHGFRVEMRPSRAGGPVVPMMRIGAPYRCLAQYVDGRPANAANPIPELTGDLVALEIYHRPDSIPLSRRADLRVVGGPMAIQHCVVVVYWTPRAPV